MLFSHSDISFSVSWFFPRVNTGSSVDNVSGAYSSREFYGKKFWKCLLFFGRVNLTRFSGPARRFFGLDQNFMFLQFSRVCFHSPESHRYFYYSQQREKDWNVDFTKSCGFISSNSNQIKGWFLNIFSFINVRQKISIVNNKKNLNKLINFDFIKTIFEQINKL